MRGSRFKLKPCTLLAASVSLIFAQAPLWANPTAPQVVNGAVSFQQPGSGLLNITNSPGSIINWQGFSIGASEITRFIQQSASSAVLNRVIGGNVSQIYGQLLSNGQVFLINPGGIVVGPGAIVDTAGFVASTLNMLDADFLAGRLKFQGDGGSGPIVNQGWVRTGSGGRVILVAPQIENQGLIQTPGGELLLAAGQKLTIGSLDLDGVQFEVQAPTDTVVNLGKLLADGGAVGVFAGTLKHSGEIRANALAYDEAGRVVLKAQNGIQLAAGSSVVADGRTGGGITVQTSAGLTRVAGTVSAQGSDGRGGDIRVLGNRVAIVESAELNASGTAGGGQVLVGGDYQGSNASIQNSTNTFVGAAAALRADATQSGNGGRIIVWSDDKTQFYGSLSAQGGLAGGDGGFAEVSGKQGLVFAGTANLGAPNGRLGNLLLDPLDLFVFAGGGADATIIDETTDFPSNAATVDPATLAAITGNVTLSASRYMRIGSPVTLTTSGQSLTATVGTYTAPSSPDPLALSTNTIFNELEIGANITTAGGAVSLTAPSIQSTAASTIATAGGTINLSAANSIQGSNLSLNAGSAAVNATSTSSFVQLAAVTGGSFTATAPSFISIGGAIATSGGAVSLTSTGSSVTASSGITSGGGAVTLNGTSQVSNFGTISAGSGAVSLSGSSVSGGTIDTTGAVTLTASSSGSIFSTVNNASSITATAGFGVSINSTTDLNVANVTAGTTSAASLSTTNGSIRGTGASPLVKGLDVSLLTTAGTGGGIGTPSTALNVDVQRNFTFRPNGDFNILLTGTGPIGLTAQLTPANTGTYSGTLTKQGGSLTLNASADTTSVTLSNLSITSGFDQQVFFGNPFIAVQTTNNANLVASSVTVPTGDTQPTVTGVHTEVPLPVTLTAAGTGNLTLSNYTRTGGGLAKTTTLSAGGSVTLGNVNASKDTVSVTGPSGITVGSLVSTGNITLSASNGPVNAQSDNAGVEVTSSSGTLSITGKGIGTSAFGNPLDLDASTVSLTSTGGAAIGGANPVRTANTQTLTVNAGSGSTFNVSTGATSLTSLTVTASPSAIGDTGTAQVVTDTAVSYVFDADSLGNFTFNPPTSSGRNVSFTSTSGDITLGTADLGTGNLVVATNGGSILGGSAVTAANVTLTAAPFNFSNSSVTVGNVTATGATGAIQVKGNNAISTGNLIAPGSVTVAESCGCGFSPDITIAGTIGNLTTAPQTISVRGGTVDVGAVTGSGNVTLAANSGPLTVGAITGGAGSTIDLTANDVAAFNFSTINAGATGSVIIKSFEGITQDAGGGITAQTVTLIGSGTAQFSSPTASIASPTVPLKLTGAKNLTVNVTGSTDIDANGSQFDSITITRGGTPLDAFNLNNMAAGQDVNIGGPSTGPFTVDAVSPAGIPLAFTFTTSSFGMGIQLGAAGIVTSGGLVNLNAAGTLDTSGGTITTGGGAVTLGASGTGGITAGTITTGGGAVTMTANSGAVAAGGITTSGGNISITTFPTAGDISLGGNLDSGSGSITLRAFGGGNISGAGTLTSTTSVTATTANGVIGVPAGVAPAVPLAITSPMVTLTANRGSTATGSEGTVLATLTGTSNLTLTGDRGFDVTSDTGFTTLSVSTKGTGAGAVNLGASGQTYSFARPATDLFGASVSGSAFEIVSVNAPTANATFTASDGILLVRGAAGGPNKINVQNLTLAATNGGDISLQGNSANPLNLSNAIQNFSAGSTSTADLLIHGTVTLNATTSQSLGASGNITVNADAGGGGGVTISAPTQTFTTTGFASKMEFLGGAASGEKVTVTATADQFIQATSSSVDSFKLVGGSGADASVTLSHSGTGFQTFQMQSGTLTVAGGSGQNAFAKVEETGTNQQRICFQTFFFCNPIGALQVLGGSGAGAFGQITASGSQFVRVSGATVVKAGTGDGANALIQSGTGASQSFFLGSLTVEGQGGAGAVGKAEILASGFQDVNATNIAVRAGASNGSLARIATTGGQDISASGTLSLIAMGTEGAGALQNASAIIEGNGQSVFASGGITLNAGSGTASGTTSDALIRNLSGSQSVSTSGALILDGGHQFSTAGILNQGTGTQSVSSFGSGGITLRSDTDGANSPHADSVVVIQNQPATLQTISSSGGVKLSNNGGGTVGITSAGTQTVTAQFIEVLTGPSTETGPNSSKIFATGDQRIHTTNSSTSGFASLRVAALGTGTASVESGASQLLELDYPEQMQGANRDGRLIVGDVNAVGTSLVQAVDQAVFARLILVQAGAANSLSKLSASESQTITTLQGGIQVLGGSGTDSLATIDPLAQTILSNGTIAVTGGAGNNADASIVSGGTQTILTTLGDVALTGGSGTGADAIIDATGAQTISANGSIALLGGAGANADASIVTVDAQTITAINGDVTLTGGSGAGSDAFITGGTPQSIVAAGSVILTPNTSQNSNAFIQGPSTTSSSSGILDTTSLIVPLQQDVATAISVIEPEVVTEEPVFGRRAPVCR